MWLSLFWGLVTTLAARPSSGMTATCLYVVVLVKLFLDERKHADSDCFMSCCVDVVQQSWVDDTLLFVKKWLFHETSCSICVCMDLRLTYSM